jgi:hypothetical protein
MNKLLIRSLSRRSPNFSSYYTSYSLSLSAPSGTLPVISTVIQAVILQPFKAVIQAVIYVALESVTALPAALQVTL